MIPRGLRAPRVVGVAAAAAISAAASALAAGPAVADERRYALIIGYNAPPTGAGSDQATALRFADDDAFAFFRFRRELGDRAILLASPDADTRRRYPDIVDQAAPPTIAALDEAVARLAADIQADARARRTSVFSFFYSGHGTRDGDGGGALALADGALSRRMLYERILDRVRADVVHLYVDACHAEAIVRPRDSDAAAVALSSEDVTSYISQSTLARYPRVGAAIASSRDAAAHEWDQYQSGVFTHELLSALRGAADINGDRRVEYSELAAFLAAANREVRDPRARLQAIVRPPAAALHAPLVDLAQARTDGRLTRIPSAPGAFYIEDDRGNRLADGHPEMGFLMSLTLPAGQRLFVRRDGEEVELILKPGADTDFAVLAFKPGALRPRGALDTSLREGLFLAPFGPAYYLGYIDRQESVTVPVTRDALAIPAGLTLTAAARMTGAMHDRRRAARATAVGATVAFLAASAVMGVMSWDAWRDNRNAVERDSIDADRRFSTDTWLATAFLITGLASGGLALYLGRDP